jgi:uncharacterized membrane protein YuzA (DUF378 family)
MLKNLGCVSLLLTIIGGINWLFVGLFEFNLVYVVVGAFPMAEKAIYCLVGLASLYSIKLFKHLKRT